MRIDKPAIVVPHLTVLSAAVISAIGLGLQAPKAQAAIESPACDVVANADNINVIANQGITIDVLANDTGSIDTASIALVGAQSTQGGSIALEGTRVRYTPPQGFEGTDTFRYRITETDYRAANQTPEVVFTHAAPEGDNIDDAERALGQWAESTASQNRYVGRVLDPEISIQACRAGTPDNTQISLSLAWELEKTTGSADERDNYEASVTYNDDDPLSGPGQLLATRADRNTPVTLSHDSGPYNAESFNALRIGLYAKHFSELSGFHFWNSNDITLTSVVDTSACELCDAEVEVTLVVGNDSDGDGIPNPADADRDNDGIPNDQEGTGDNDNDGISNDLDLDSDNDGIADILEAGGEDADNNGRADAGEDANGDGLIDAFVTVPLPLPDSDGDGVRDVVDIESDNDGVPDLVEAGGPDNNGDGRVDGFQDRNNNGWHDEYEGAAGRERLPLPNTDNAGAIDVLDLESDGDDILDIVEAGGAEHDSLDPDGRVDELRDKNRDGILDVVDVATTQGEDSNGNQIDDSVDAAVVENPVDTDGDGIIDSGDPDANGDGMIDIFNTATNGTPLPLPDSDDDGIRDIVDSENNTPKVNPQTDGANPGEVITGVQGSGAGGFNPLFSLLMIPSIAYIVRRRRTKR